MEVKYVGTLAAARLQQFGQLGVAGQGLRPGPSTPVDGANVDGLVDEEDYNQGWVGER